MKKFTSIITALLVSGCLYAQSGPDQRTTTTKIADILARFPANGQAELQKYCSEIAALGADGVSQMTDMLVAPGKGDNTKTEYALAGYTFYVTGKGLDMQRQAAARAFTASLGRASATETKAFIIRQLQTLADPVAIPALQPLLTDPFLADPTARALVKINTPESKQAIYNALSKSKGLVQQTLVQALGDASYSPANAAIMQLAATGSPDLQKVAHYALSRIADPAAGPLLKSAAARTGWNYDRTNATASYFTWLSLLADKKQVATLATAILNDTKTPARENAYIAALQLLADNKGTTAFPQFLAATSDPRTRVKDAGWKLIGRYANDLQAPQQALVLKQLRATDNTTKAAALRILADNKVQFALPVATEMLQDKNPAVKAAAADAAGRIGGAVSLPGLMAALHSSDTITVSAVRNTLLLLPGSVVTNALATAYPSLTNTGKAAAISVLAARRDVDHANLILDAVASSDAGVHRAGMNALRFTATEKDIPALVQLLNTANSEEEIKAAQQGIISAGINASSLQQYMQQAGPDKQSRYLGILAGLGSKEAVEQTVNAFNNGNEQTKAAALSALTEWSNANAAPALLAIARNKSLPSYQEQAQLGYLAITAKSQQPADQKVLMVRNILDLAPGTKVKLKALEVLDKSKSYNSLLLASRYMDDPTTTAEAALVSMDIALADKSLAGPEVKAILEKAAAGLKGGDADYQRQSIRKFLAEMPTGEGFVTMFNGKDLSGWKGLVENPLKRAQMNEKVLKAAQSKADDIMRKGWSVQDGMLVFNGEGDNLCTEKKYSDFEMLVDWKITSKGDAGIYLRGSPQVQIWDTSRVDVGAQVGSGGLYNNQQHESKPLKLADNAIGEWNHFRIIMKGDRVTVYLNGQLVTNNIILENYWDRGLPIFPAEQIELQAHGTNVTYRDLYIREIPRPQPVVLSNEEQKAGYKLLFDGTNMHAWTGNTTDYIMENGDMVIYPKMGGHGNLYTKEEYKNFSFRFEFQLTPGANNGVGIRAPLEGDAAYKGMEIQILDNDAEIYKKLHEYQYHGSVYGVIPAKRGFLKPVGEWNQEEIIANGTRIKVILNGEVIVDGDIADARDHGTMDQKDHPGLKNETGHIGFLGHGDVVRFRNIRVKTL
ncbi:MAG: DUF1080 domain-containing protein [Chitinophaga sp.]|uniref:DUF1080 domain-containing protein n=1 Tax=Chitinophaga sp. TaxID=1869181 RepID=UPI0025BF29FF|nr:family 16 glycoside hydrolase [Chitinophaga sp.]MBV8252166.1 DUF1080 domain-containing protein [Chitinophaga sp.]